MASRETWKKRFLIIIKTLSIMRVGNIYQTLTTISYMDLFIKIKNINYFLNDVFFLIRTHDFTKFYMR